MSLRHRTTVRLAVVLLAGAGALGACSSSSTSAPASTVPSPSAAPTSTTLDPSSVKFHGERYCEVLLLTQLAPAVADVYNSFPMNRCPAEQWDTADAKQIAREHSVPIAVLNGPRYWLMDHIEQSSANAVEQLRVTFAGVEMVRRATVQVGSLRSASKPYALHEVNRAARFTFDAGTKVFELHDPSGPTYVMQSYSTQQDATLTETSLEGLGARLQLPTGWRFASRVLAQPLVVDTRSAPAHVLQDELGNSYSLEAAD